MNVEDDARSPESLEWLRRGRAIPPCQRAIKANSRFCGSNMSTLRVASLAPGTRVLVPIIALDLLCATIGAVEGLGGASRGSERVASRVVGNVQYLSCG